MKHSFPISQCRPLIWRAIALLFLLLPGVSHIVKAQPAAGGTPSAHALIVCQDGTVQGWGGNYSGELGNLPQQNPTPTTIASQGLTNIVSVAVGDVCSYAIKQDGTLLAWGSNTSGKLGIGSTAVSVATPTVVPIPGLRPIVAVAAGSGHAIALASDGTVWTWGQNANGQLGTGNGSTSPGTTRNVPAQVPAAFFSSPVKAVDAGSSYSLALCTNGAVYSWGYNMYGELGQGTALGSYSYTPGLVAFSPPYPGAPAPVIVKIAAGFSNSLALDSNHSVYAWGVNTHGSVGDGTTTNRNTPVEIGMLSGAVDITTANHTCCAVFANGTTKTWGENYTGGLGNCLPQQQANSPVTGPTFTSGVKVRGTGHIFTSVETSGAVKVWGWLPLGYTSTNPTIYGDGSCLPRSPVGICAALPCAPVSISASQPSVCLGGQLTLTATGGDGTPILWSPMTDVVSSINNSITVSPTANTTYTAVSGCGAPTTYQVVVKTDCCVQQQVAYTDMAGTYSSYAFQVGQYYRIPANTTVTLTTGTFTLTNATLLLGENAVLKVDNGAQLRLLGSTVTAACDQMWGSIRVTNTAGGMSTSSYGGRDCRIMHSTDGVVYEQDYGAPYAYFRFSQTHFRHNLRSVTINREGTSATSTDRITFCTFDSEPDKFLKPYKQMGYYSVWHLGVRGSIQPAYIFANDFKRAYFGVYLLDVAHPNVALTLNKNTFSDCWFGGVYAPNGQWIANSSSLTLTENTFTFPATKTFPATAQTTSVQASYTNGAPAETYGAYMRYGSIVADNNKFQQLDSATTVLMNDYSMFGQYRPRQTGLYAPRMPNVSYNRFYLLDTGINVLDVPAGQQTTMQGNGFANCRLGLQAATQSSSAQLHASCNTFRRDNFRSGTSTGIALNLPSYSYGGGTVWPRILIRDFRSTFALYPLRNLFDDGGVNSTINFPAKRLVALSNNSPAGAGQYTLSYQTFSNYFQNYDDWSSSNVTVTAVGTINIDPLESRPNITNGPCKADGFPAAGLQQRPANPGIAPAPTIRPQLAQNSPNPCSGSTTVHYQLPAGKTDARLLLRRSTDGRTVQQVALDAATTQQELNLRSYEPGVYFATLLVGHAAVQTIRILVK